MAESLRNLIQWTASTYSIREFLDIYEARLPILALVKSVGVPPKTAHNLTTTEMIFVGQVLKVESATEGQKRLIIEVVPQRLSLNIPLDCPAKFDIPHLKKKKLKLNKILSSSKYSLPLVAETSSKYSAYFEKAGAKATGGDAKKRTVKMVFKKLKEKERFLKTNFIHEGAESPLVTFISADLPIEVAVVESYIGPGTEERLRSKYQLTPSPAKVKVNGKKKKRSPDGQLVIGAGLYIMMETSANNNYIINNEDGSAEASPRSPREVAAAAAAAAEDVQIDDDVDGIELDAAQEDIALNADRNSRDNATVDAATGEREERDAADDKEEEEEEKEEEGEDIRQRNGDLSASVPEVSDVVVLQRVGGVADATEEVSADRRKDDPCTAKEVGMKAKQKPVSESIDPNQSSAQSYPDQSNVEKINQISRYAAVKRQWTEESEIRVEGHVESPGTGIEMHIYDEIRRRQVETVTIDRGSKTNFFDDLSLESEESADSPNSSDRIDDVDLQIKRVAQVAPVSQELKRPTPMPRQSLRSKRSLAQQLITEMSLGSTGVFSVELLPLGQLDDGDHQKLHNGGPLRNQAFVSDDEDETSNEILSPEGNKYRMNSRSPPTQRRNLLAKSVSSNDSFSVSQRNDFGRAQLENGVFFGESFVSVDTKKHYTVGISKDCNTKGTFITATDSSEVFRTEDTTMIKPWSKASLSQAYSLDRRQTYQAKGVRLGSQNTDDASTQTMSPQTMSPSYPSIDRRAIEEHSFTVPSPSRPVDRSLQRGTVVQVPGGRHHQQLPSATSEVHMDEIHGRKVRRNDSMIQRIILNDSEQATCKITSFTSTPNSDRSTDANVSYRVPSFRTEHAAPLPSISTLPRKWTSSTPVQTPLTSTVHRHVVTVELPPYFEFSSRVTSFNPDSTARNQMVDATPSGRFVNDVDHWNSSKSTPDLLVKPRGNSRFQTAAHTASEPLRSGDSTSRGFQETTGYTIRINTHEDRQDQSIDRRTRARQNKERDDSHLQTRGRTEMETGENNARMAKITKENVVVVTTRKDSDFYKSRKTIGRSRTTASDAPRNLSQPGQRGAARLKERFLDEVEVDRSGNTSRRTMGHLHCTTRTRSLDSPTCYQRAEEKELQSRERKGDLPEQANLSGLVVTTSECVLQSNENSHMKPEQNRHFTSNGNASAVLKHRSSNRITSEHDPNSNLSSPLQVRHTQKSRRTPEEFDYCDSSMIQPPNHHQQRRSKYKADETKSRGIEQFRVRTSENAIRPSYDVRTSEEIPRSTMIARATVPAHNAKRGTLEKHGSDATTPDLYHANRKENNVIHQTKYTRADMKQSRNIHAPENEFALTGKSMVSVRNDDIKRTSNEIEKRAQRKPHHQPSHNRRDNYAKAGASAAIISGYNEYKHENHSYGAINANQKHPPNRTTGYANSATPVATTTEKSSPYLIVSTHASANGSAAEPYPQLPLGQSASNGINQVHEMKKSRRRRNKEIAADQELTYPIDLTVRESIRSLDRFLKEQDPDAQSIASSQFTEHHELIIHHDITGTNNF